MRLYVGGLPYQTNEHDLTSLFEQVGTVTSVTVITDRETGRSKGFGFVDMNTTQDGQRAIEQLNGSLLGERTITVNEARERQNVGGTQRRSDYRSQRYKRKKNITEKRLSHHRDSRFSLVGVKKPCSHAPDSSYRPARMHLTQQFSSTISISQVVLSLA